MITPIQFYKCLADEIRLTSLLLIELEQELCVCELMQAMDQLSQPKVSRHLAQLRKAGLLIDRKHQQWVYYRINTALPGWMLDVIKLTAGQNLPLLQASQKRLNAMGCRPKRSESYCKGSN